MADEKDTRVSVAIIGGGFGGIGAGVNLKRRGVHGFTIFEKSDGVGGTWWDNRYPGAECDVPSAMYSYSFKLHDWTRTHAPWNEIQAYLEETVDQYGLRKHIRTGVGVERASWDEERKQYLVTLDTGEQLWFDVVISAVGMLNVPNIPRWENRDSFPGPVMHSARWDPSVDLEGKRIAVVGAGASAAQVVPALQPRAKELISFQREPGWVLPKGDHDLSRQERAQLNRFGRRRLARWKLIRQFNKTGGGANTAAIAAQQERLEARIRNEFADRPDLAEDLLPTFQPRCKRNVLSDIFYPALKQPNVSLVKRSVTDLTPRGVIDSEGQEHEVDAVILTTGFQAANFLSTFDITGRSGRRLRDVWGDDPQAFLGITVPDFPNFYILYGPNTHGTVVAYVLERQAEFAARDIRALQRRGGGTVEVRPTANDRYQRALESAIDAVESWKSGCNNYYLSASGRNVVQWPWTHFRYHVSGLFLRRWSSTRKRLPSSARVARSRPQFPARAAA